MLKAKRNAVVDAVTGEQMAVVLPSACGRRDAERWAQYIVDRVNADERGKAVRTAPETRVSEGIKIGDPVRITLGIHSEIPTEGWTVYKLPTPEWRSYGLKHVNGGDMSINEEYVVPV